MASEGYSTFRRAICSSLHGSQYDRKMGEFDPMRLVVQLDSSVTSIIESGASGLTNPTDPRTKAFGSYLHETIHWWQHIGTTSGLISALTIPVQSHINQDEIRALSDIVIPRKSMFTYWYEEYENLPDDAKNKLNIIVNNWSDLEFSYSILVHPKQVVAGLNSGKTVPSIKFFESVGHAIGWHYLSTVNILAASLDPGFKSLPDIRKWQEGFDDLKQRKITNYYFGSEVMLPPVGRAEITEGQARFQELQYLSRASGADLSMKDFKRRDFLDERYTHAFDAFLEASDLDCPAHPLSPVVDLFMVVCDIALNPSVGYPEDISNYEQFVEDVSPGIRFMVAANVVRRLPGLTRKLRRLNGEEYDEVAGSICDLMGTRTPRENAEAIVRMSEGMPTTNELNKEMTVGVMKPNSMPIRFCFAKHLNLMKDKADYPQYFCWPSVSWSEFNGPSDLDSLNLFYRNSCPFVRTSLAGEVRPNLNQFVNPKSAGELVATYFRWQIIYDLVRQWISEDGPLKFDYQWMDPGKGPKEFRDLVAEDFARAFGCDLESIRVYRPRL
jgi:hypothetical protein